MRIGILGLGRIGAFHAETLAGLDVVESLVVTDPLAAAAATAAERFGATVADSPEAVLAAGVDGVVVAAATDAHPGLILAAVEAGIPVFCEKPVARDDRGEPRGAAGGRGQRRRRSRSATTAASTRAVVAARRRRA